MISGAADWGGSHLSSPKKKRRKGSGILSNSIYLLLVIAAAFLLNSFVITRDVVSGDSMYDTLSDKDVVMINRLTYSFSSPKRFDIVVFPDSDSLGGDIVKRIVGLPGETVRIDDEGNIYINERLLNEHYGIETIKDPGLASGRGITLSSDEYFVLGDNRNNSMDSRFAQIRNVKRSRIKGKVFFRILPLSSFGAVGK